MMIHTKHCQYQVKCSILIDFSRVLSIRVTWFFWLYTSWILLVSWIIINNHGDIYLPTTLGWWYAHGVIVSTAVSESSHFGRPSGQCPKILWPGEVTIWLF